MPTTSRLATRAGTCHLHQPALACQPLTSSSRPHCRFAGNTAQAGGGLFELNVEGNVDQCAFESNIGSSQDQGFGSGGGVSQSGGSGDVTNSIFIGNTVPSPSKSHPESHYRPSLFAQRLLSITYRYLEASWGDWLAGGMCWCHSISCIYKQDEV